MKFNSPIHREVNIDGQDCVVTIAQSGRSTWKAWGDCWGRHVVAAGSSENNAYSNWKDNALALNK